MRINESFFINNNYNWVLPSNFSGEKYSFFTYKTILPDLTKASYLSSHKCFELKELVGRYDLTDNNVLISEKLNIAREVRKNFITEFGTIKSSSMQELILNPLSPDYDLSLSDSINKMRQECRKSTDYVQSLKNKMLERKIGNCTDIALVTANEINQKQGNCRAKLLYARILNDNVISNHVAVLVKNKSESDKLTPDSIVLDNWLGGVFKYSDWLKIVKQIYNSKEVKPYVTQPE